MRVKKFITGVKSQSEWENDLLEKAKKIDNGEYRQKSEYQIYFEDENLLNKAFSPERLKILKTIKSEKPDSIYKLAKILDKDFKYVYTEVKYLKSLGLLELHKQTINNKIKIIPEVKYDKLVYEIIF